MATTLLAKKANSEKPIALDDDHHEALASDPTINQFPQGSSFSGGFENATTATTGFTTGPSTFGSAPTGGFNTPGSFGAPASAGFASNSGVGAGANQTSQAGAIQVTQNQGESLKSGGGAMSQGGESTVALDQGATDWINKKMRPMMGWIYMLTCTCDFVLFPILWSLLQAMSKGQVTSQWQPLTLQGAGLYHIAMGAVLGIAAYGRTKEKVAGVAS